VTANVRRQNSIVCFVRNEYVVKGPSPANGISHDHLTKTIGDGRFDIRNPKDRDEDAMTENTSRTDDDPVGDAFRHALDADLEDDDGDDEIVWNPRCVC
jgi:hypothetical protein